MRRFLIPAAILAVLLVPLAAAAETDCLVCHNSMSGKVMGSHGEIDLRVDAGKFQSSVHGFLSCTDCHLKFGENPHVTPGGTAPAEVESLARMISEKAPSDPVALAACSNCHGPIYEEVLGSVHGANITGQDRGDGALCLDCHGSPHYVAKSGDSASPANRVNIVATCGNCHGSDVITDKYGISHNVMRSYNESFHGKKYALGHDNAPTCASCHGYHGVKRSDDPASPIYAANKTKTCGRCHAGANEKFVSAISHEEPGPIPHYSEIALIILTISVFAFTISHVILEAFSDIRDTFFRRTKEVKDEGR